MSSILQHRSSLKGPDPVILAACFTTSSVMVGLCCLRMPYRSRCFSALVLHPPTNPTHPRTYLSEDTASKAYPTRRSTERRSIDTGSTSKASLGVASLAVLALHPAWLRIILSPDSPIEANMSKHEIVIAATFIGHCLGIFKFWKERKERKEDEEREERRRARRARRNRDRYESYDRDRRPRRRGSRERRRRR